MMSRLLAALAAVLILAPVWAQSSPPKIIWTIRLDVDVRGPALRDALVSGLSQRIRKLPDVELVNGKADFDMLIMASPRGNAISLSIEQPFDPITITWDLFGGNPDSEER